MNMDFFFFFFFFFLTNKQTKKGNGIQDIFYDDPDVLYISIHRYDNLNFYPFSPKANLTAVGGTNAKGR